MADFENRKGFYSDWSDNKRVEFIRQAHAIIKKRIVYGFADAILVKDWKEVLDERHIGKKKKATRAVYFFVNKHYVLFTKGAKYSKNRADFFCL